MQALLQNHGEPGDLYSILAPIVQGWRRREHSGTWQRWDELNLSCHGDRSNRRKQGWEWALSKRGFSYGADSDYEWTPKITLQEEEKKKTWWQVETAIDGLDKGRCRHENTGTATQRNNRLESQDWRRVEQDGEYVGSAADLGCRFVQYHGLGLLRWFQWDWGDGW